jgi:hypothetical protein
MNDARQNNVKLPIWRAVIVIRQSMIPNPKNTMSPIFLPSRCIVLDTKTTLQAVPVIISAIGAVAQSGDGASLLPARVPARCMSGSVEPAIALPMLRSQAFLNSLEKIRVMIVPFFNVDSKEILIGRHNHKLINGIMG